jgi:hypothetical protein
MLRHAPIRSKVVAILILPLAGLVVLAAVGIGTTLARGAEAGRRNDLAQLAVRGNTLVHELQAERGDWWWSTSPPPEEPGRASSCWNESCTGCAAYRQRPQIPTSFIAGSSGEA